MGGKRDEGSMILCDMCEHWSHVPCVNVLLPPGTLPQDFEEESKTWLCPQCMADIKEDYESKLKQQLDFL